MVLTKCPCCNHIDDNDLFFSWGADDNGHPTIEKMWCPKCDATNIEPWYPNRDERGRFIKMPKIWQLSDFIELEEDEVDSEILSDIKTRYNQRQEAKRIAKEKDMQEWNDWLKSTSKQT